MPSAVQVVLLDLGGVLLNLHDPLVTFGLELQQDKFLETWLLSPSVRKFERGEISISQFASDIVAEFTLPYSPAEFARRFESWPDALYEGVPDLLKSIGRRYQVALLSNTNEAHWDREDVAGQLVPLLHAVFLSYQTRHLKPEPDAFEDVLQHFGIAADEFLFLDDNPLNIAAARKCGMQARLTNGFESLIQNLSRAGVTKTPT
jgi:putative hydrolase of the HAD superfamily